MSGIRVHQKVNEIFKPLWGEDWRYAFLMGGRGAGRSTAGSQWDLSHLLAPEYFRCALMRATHTDIRHSCWRELIDRMHEQHAEKAFRITDGDMRVEYGENSIQAHGFRASSGSLTARLKSLANYNAVDIEEAEEVGESEFRKLDDSLRTKKGRIRIMLRLNSPAKSHWIIQDFFDLEPHPVAKGFYIPHIKPGIDAIHVAGTYRDNLANIDDTTARRYARYKETKPAYYWQMIEGLVPEVVRGKIYKGWELVDEVPDEATLLRIGGDWGWYPDPVSTIALYYCDGIYYVDGITYGTEIDDVAVAAEIKNIHNGNRVRAVFGADEPKSVELMCDNGLNAVRSITGPGSVKTRIKATAEKRIRVVKKDHPLYGNWVWDAYERYRWAEDKDGNPKGEPDHDGSDPMDAISYAIADLTEDQEEEVWQYTPQNSRRRR